MISRVRGYVAHIKITTLWCLFCFMANIRHEPSRLLTFGGIGGVAVGMAGKDI